MYCRILTPRIPFQNLGSNMLCISVFKYTIPLKDSDLYIYPKSISYRLLLQAYSLYIIQINLYIFDSILLIYLCLFFYFLIITCTLVIFKSISIVNLYFPQTPALYYTFLIRVSSLPPLAAPSSLLLAFSLLR